VNVIIIYATLNNSKGTMIEGKGGRGKQ